MRVHRTNSSRSLVAPPDGGAEPVDPVAGGRMGASVADHQPQAEVRVMLDPDGHPFCLFASTRM